MFNHIISARKSKFMLKVGKVLYVARNKPTFDQLIELNLVSLSRNDVTDSNTVSLIIVSLIFMFFFFFFNYLILM